MDYDVWNSVKFSYHEHNINIEDQEVIKPRDKWDSIKKLLMLKPWVFYIVRLLLKN